MTLALLALVQLGFSDDPAGTPNPASATEMLPMSGEVTATSALVQARHPPGARSNGGRFLLSPADGTAEDERSAGCTAKEQYDWIVRRQFDRLKPDTPYEFRYVTHCGVSSPVGRFRTLPGEESETPVSFVVVTGLNYAKFHGSSAIDRKQHLEQNNTELPPPAPESQRKLGYPGLEAIQNDKPHFVVYTGDTVYYDTPKEGRATDRPSMRAKWRENFVQPRFRDLLAATPAYHMKDDHDFRKDDSDNSGDYEPSPELGIELFKEQVPVVPPGKDSPFDETTPTYRTVRCNADLQVWIVEGRDYRSANKSPDGLGKTIWGEEQFRWLTRTLKESDATFKVLVSPTPMVGPDDKRKTDNHTNFGGFRHERQRFFDFLKEEGMLQSGEFLVLCGDRHWQYHAEHPVGLHEFSSGAIHDANSRPGRVAGDPKSTDPDAKIVQYYLMGIESKRAEDGRIEQYGSAASGGYLSVEVARGNWRGEGEEARLHLVHKVTRKLKDSDPNEPLTTVAYETDWYRTDAP
ncbi:MAG: alkaline phosphatase D family protein [Planctomycetota bacterium]